MQPSGNRPTLGGMVLQHVIVFLICVVFPGGVTVMAPATWITLERSGEKVNCTTRTCAFFILPFKIQHVDQVTEISHRERVGKTERQREFGRDKYKTVNVDGEGYLQIHGVGDELIEVSVTPASLESVASNSNDFLTLSEEQSTTIFAIANWKFGGLMGGILTLFTLLYVVGYSLGFLKWILMGLKTTFTSSET